MPASLPATIAIGVFGLFHSQAFYIAPWGTSRVAVRCGSAEHVLEGKQSLRLTDACSTTGPNDFELSIPGKIRRHYRGTLRTIPAAGELLAVVTMDLETAVASSVAAEAPPGAPPAMLEAQAIVARSYYSGPRRHAEFDFCDTTHCQFIKDPPAAPAPAKGQVLAYHDRVITAFYSARCNGKLEPIAADRLAPGDYPYYAVKCEYCLRHPDRSEAKANARPHHHGMCQLGAADLARQGWSAVQILAHYYPGAEVR